MKNLRIQAETSEASITNRIQELQGTISSIKDTIVEMDSLVKEKVEYKETPGAKHSGYLEYYEKTKSKNME